MQRARVLFESPALPTVAVQDRGMLFCWGPPPGEGVLVVFRQSKCRSRQR
jgi:hypothetical protein